MGFMGIHFNINDLISEFQDKVDRTPQLGINLVDGIAEDIRYYMVIGAPFKWGDLREGHIVVALSEWIREIFSDVPHFDWVVGGTRPHWIRPIGISTYMGMVIREGSGKQALYWEGAEHPVREVFHPGTAPNDYPSWAIDNADGAINTRANEFLDQVVN